MDIHNWKGYAFHRMIDFSLRGVIILFNLRGTMCTPSCGQNDIFSFLDRPNHITTCLPRDHFNVIHPLQVPILL